jgi:Zn-dependent alcohol dehydrogenases, class III
VTAGLPPPADTFPLPQVNLVAEERTIKGSYIGTCVPLRDIPRYIALYRRGRLPVDRLMSGHLELDEINTGFDRLAEGNAVRQVVTMP